MKLDKSKFVCHVKGTPHAFNGLCTYLHSAGASGFVYDEIEFKDRPSLRLFIEQRRKIEVL